LAGRSTRIQHRDILQVMRLVGDVRTFGPDPLAWRQHAATGLSRLTNAAVAISMQGSLGPAGPTIFALTNVGWQSPAHQQIFCDWLQSKDFSSDPLVATLLRLGNATFGWMRRQVIPDPQWYSATRARELRRRAGVDDCAVSSVHLPDGGVDQISLHRSWGDPSFARRDSVLLCLFHRELQRLWFDAAARRSPAEHLPAYLQRTLDTLLQGCSEREAAARLNLTESTLHTYVKQLYAKFKVNSRRELIENFGINISIPRLAGRRADPSSAAANRGSARLEHSRQFV
jgi:hypothetical protein